MPDSFHQFASQKLQIPQRLYLSLWSIALKAFSFDFFFNECFINILNILMWVQARHPFVLVSKNLCFAIVFKASAWYQERVRKRLK
jgi:hypothetical protein